MNPELFLERAGDMARRLPEPLIRKVLTLALAVPAIWLLAGLCWQLATPVEPVKPWTPTAAGNGQAQLDLNGLKAHPLFGSAPNEAPAPVQTEVVDAPETRLQLKLSGLVAESNTGSGVAIIESQGSQAAYRVGDDIKGTSAKVERILADRVLLKNRNQTEALMLEGKDYQPLKVQGPQPRTRPGFGSARPGLARSKVSSREVQDTLAKAKADPDSINDLVHLTPLRGKDGITGYLVTPGNKPQLFKTLGLQNGDLVKAINGYDLTDPAQALDILSQLGTLDSLTLDLERNGQAMSLNIGVEQ
ncbi:type II secretion system protein GspC [Gallaecimonas kandeliae]|uniref:type II secretion system protein GspC n=1 Tax=Gallaecimonas kandeliae TaxID=3029055 RepID=UPI00264778E3|nr:type II secretion system protein GspC [Gallaecimonas kandeliae]WKE65913.1 type II secretion system protein GspC [Gallaecimonas kandeliae]